MFQNLKMIKIYVFVWVMRLLLGGYLIETKLVNQYCIKVPSSISIYATIYPNYLSINTIYIYIHQYCKGTLHEISGQSKISISKELSFCHKFWFSNLDIVAPQCRRPLIFQTMINAVRLNNVNIKSLHHQIGISKMN